MSRRSISPTLKLRLLETRSYSSSFLGNASTISLSTNTHLSQKMSTRTPVRVLIQSPAVSKGNMASLIRPEGQDPDLTELPFEQEVDLLDEAMEYYTSDSPIFLQDITQQKKPGTVTHALFAKDGSAAGRKVALTTRVWGSRGVYQTLDINGQRVIIKGFKGGPRGWIYRRWMGVLQGFEKQPIAVAIKENPPADHGKKKRAPPERIWESSDEEFQPSRQKSTSPALRIMRARH